MVDMHNHILYAVDDGASNFDESISIAKELVKEGVTKVIATPHAHHRLYNTDILIVKENLETLNQSLKNRYINLEVSLGQEVRIHEELLSNLSNNKVLTLNNSNYLLLELPSSNVPLYTPTIISELLTLNIIPIIAHPERNKVFTQQPEVLENLIRVGALAQVTSGSITGHFGKQIQKSALKLIDSNLIHLIGSDTHNLKNRPPLFKKSLEYLNKHNRADYADFFISNNEYVFHNKQVEIIEPNLNTKKYWWKFLRK